MIDVPFAHVPMLNPDLVDEAPASVAVRTLSWQGALTVGTLGISAPRTKMSPSGGFDDATVQSIEQLTDHLVDALSMSASPLLERVASIVELFGIDPARFGDLSERTRPSA